MLVAATSVAGETQLAAAAAAVGPRQGSTDSTLALACTSDWAARVRRTVKCDQHRQG